MTETTGRWWPLAAALLVALFSACAVADDPPRDGYALREASRTGTGKVYMGREIANVMSHHSMRSLERASREEEERPDLVVAALPLDEDDVVADIGAGIGYFSFPVAERVPRGVVLAVDIQQEMLDEIERRKTARGVENVRTVLGEVDDPGLDAASVDVMFIVDAYHEFSHPLEMGRAMLRALKPGGQLIVVEDRAEASDSGGNLHRMSEAQARKELEAAGFAWRRTDDFLPKQHFLVFQKPTAPANDASGARPAASDRD